MTSESSLIVTPDDAPDVYIVGDQYQELVSATHTTETTYIEGGVWYVQKILRAGLCGDDFPEPIKVSTYPIPRIPNCNVMANLTIHGTKRQPHSKIDNTMRIANTKYFNEKIEQFESNFKIPKEFVVFEDMDMGYRDRGSNEWTDLLRAWSADTANEKKRPLRNIVLLGRSLSALTKKGDDLWSKLMLNHRDDTLVIVNADLLRAMGAELSRRVSWERSALDVVAFLNSKSEFARLAQFAHLVVRFGITAAVHCFNPGSSPQYHLFYDTKCDNGYFRDVDEEGGIIGNNSVFAAAIIRECLRPSVVSSSMSQCVGRAIRTAIPTCQRMHRVGYPIFPAKGSWLANWPNSAIFDREQYIKIGVTGIRLDKKFEVTEPTSEELIHQIAIPHGSQGWSILTDSMVGTALLDTARNLVLYGVEKAVNQPPGTVHADPLATVTHAFVPKARFNNLVTFDRNEIENCRGVYNIIKAYLASDQQKPLCIAVFGPPGSGKSFTVEQIALASTNHFADCKTSGVLEPRCDVNVSQINTTDDLIQSIAETIQYRLDTSSNANGLDIGKQLIPIVPNMQRVPFIFFDEFDSSHTGHLGWLKAFLSPMEDAYILRQEGKYILSRSIFVFAGGTSFSYDSFSCEQVPSTDDRRITFVSAKGPDFISRLRGHIDIRGINPVDITDRGFVIRRAVLLRQYFKEFRYFVDLQMLDESAPKIAAIDYSVLDALLLVKSYKHGARSMKAVLSMCVPINGRIEKSSLPTDSQLNMHVDASEIHSIIREYSHPVAKAVRIDRHILT